MKRLNGIMVTYEEKKPDLTKQEKADRNDIMALLRESIRLLKFDFED